MTDYTLPVHLNAVGYAALLDRPTYAAPEPMRMPEPAPVELTEEECLRRVAAMQERKRRR